MCCWRCGLPPRSSLHWPLSRRRAVSSANGNNSINCIDGESLRVMKYALRHHLFWSRMPFWQCAKESPDSLGMTGFSQLKVFFIPWLMWVGPFWILKRIMMGSCSNQHFVFNWLVVRLEIVQLSQNQSDSSADPRPVETSDLCNGFNASCGPVLLYKYQWMINSGMQGEWAVSEKFSVIICTFHNPSIWSGL